MKTTLIVLGWIGIVVQVLAYLGTGQTGGINVPSDPLVGLAFLFGFNLIGIVGVGLLVIASKLNKKEA